MKLEEYKKQNTLQKRQGEASRLIRKYENKRIPAVLLCDNKIKIDKVKYLVPNDLTFNQFIYVVRQQIQNVSEKDALYFFTTKGEMVSPNISMIELYEKYKDDEDGLLYLVVKIENTFG